jgi:hypothetical protein
MMQFLMLHTLDETYAQEPTVRLSPLLKREALRRLAWAVLYLDTLSDAGRHGVHTVTEDGFHIQLPCDETSFIRGLNVQTAMLHYDTAPVDIHKSAGSWLSSHTIADAAHNDSPQTSLYADSARSCEGSGHLGISAHIIRTAAMRRRILHFNSTLKYTRLSVPALLDQLQVFEHQLKRLVADLPSDLAYTEDNLFVHVERRTAFILLHMLRHNCFLMLDFATLNVCKLGMGSETASTMPSQGRVAVQEAGPMDGLSPTSTVLTTERRSRMVQGCLRRRLRHCVPVSRIIHDALRLSVNCDPFVGVQAYTALECECMHSEYLAVSLAPLLSS